MSDVVNEETEKQWTLKLTHEEPHNRLDSPNSNVLNEEIENSGH